MAELSDTRSWGGGHDAGDPTGIVKHTSDTVASLAE